MFRKVLIANRGAIACRVIRTLDKLGIASVAIYTRADAGSLHVQQASEAWCIGENLASDSYLDAEKILEVARQSGAQAIHPGYGFLSENVDFSQACAKAGIHFIGPRPEHLSAFGLKHTARQLALDCGVPLAPGSDLLDDVQAALSEAERIGYPVMLKSTAGGGGIGMQCCHDVGQLASAFDSVQRLSRNNFSNDGLFLEKFIERARHIEVQIFGDGQGGVVALGERDCSLQRRNQKVVEEAPAPRVPDAVRAAMHETAIKLGKHINYQSAGTVEYIYDDDQQMFYFLEVNTRLQVEHGVTEAVTGVDLVEWMIRLAAGERDFLQYTQYPPRGHAIQCRVYAEDPVRDFQPCAGRLTAVAWPSSVRCDTWVEQGTEVSPWYDPMLAKVIVHQSDRKTALTAMNDALMQCQLAGVETNLDYLQAIIADSHFIDGKQTTALLNDFVYHGKGLEVLDAGTQTTVQDWPGRVGYWHVGVPPSGPFDNLALRLGNRLLGNEQGAPALEMTLHGVTLRLRESLQLVITGAPVDVFVDDQPVACWKVFEVSAGSTLKVGAINEGARSYLCVAGGLQLPEYLGSASTFTLGKFGGQGGRALLAGDVLHLDTLRLHAINQQALPAQQQPVYAGEWTLRVIYGPHGAPDFFTRDDIDTFFVTNWEVHYNSSRTGIRLIGPKPQWARTDGGEAGLHPSNIHDNAYAVGAVDFTGDMPVILGPDGPSLGGFVCPVTVIRADLWKLGQLKAGDHICFMPVTVETAQQLEQQQTALIEQGAFTTEGKTTMPIVLPPSPVLDVFEPDDQVAVCYRPSGEDNMLVEYGEQVLDLSLRFRVQALMSWLQEADIKGIRELTPGIRSLQVSYDNHQLSQRALLDILQAAERELGDVSKMTVPTRIVHLPLSWDDEQCQLAIEKYMQSVNANAPWCPSNLEFIRRINGLDSIDEVKRIVFEASYLVMGLGDVYLGAPVATPLDPRHRLVTTKYNPARTWTPENAVGIGGAYLCVYGMEGPGGYQFVGRTLQMWNTWKTTAEFPPGKPWLLNFFDQLRFYPVSHEELMQLREDFPHGRASLKIEQDQFSLRDYQRFLSDNQASIDAFRQQQQTAFAAERQRWKEAGHDLAAHHETESVETDDVQPVEGERLISSHVPGSLWQYAVEEGQRFAAGDTLAVIESMKMEIPLVASCTGTVTRLLLASGAAVSPGKGILLIREDQ